MITKLDKVYISNISQNIELTGEYLRNFNYLSVTSITINSFYQLQDEKIILNEGGSIVEIILTDRTYENVNEMRQDLASLLTDNSPNTYTYTVGPFDTPINPSGKTLITCSDNVQQKSIIITKNLGLLYGFNSQINSFSGTLATDHKYNLTPISNIYIRTNLINGPQQNEHGSDVTGVYDTSRIGFNQSFDLLSNAKKYNNRNDVKVTFVDFHNDKIKIFGNFVFELSLFYLENIDFIKSYTILMEKFEELKLQNSLK